MPLFAPAVLVSIDTDRPLSLAPAAIRLPTAPLTPALPDAVALTPRLSENMSAVAVFDTVIACDTVSPTCEFANATGSGVAEPCAMRYTLPDTFTTASAKPTLVVKPLVFVPFDSPLIVTVPDFAPALPVSMPTMMPLSDAPASIRPATAPLTVALPAATLPVTSSCSE